MSMDRRKFLKLVGGGVGLVGLAALVGCPKREPEAEVAAPVDTGPVDPPGGPEGGAATQVVMVKCPKCGAENEVRTPGVEITCWKCGHKWTPQV